MNKDSAGSPVKSFYRNNPHNMEGDEFPIVFGLKTLEKFLADRDNAQKYDEQTIVDKFIEYVGHEFGLDGNFSSDPNLKVPSSTRGIAFPAKMVKQYFHSTISACIEGDELVYCSYADRVSHIRRFEYTTVYPETVEIGESDHLLERLPIELVGCYRYEFCRAGDVAVIHRNDVEIIHQDGEKQETYYSEGPVLVKIIK